MTLSTLGAVPGSQLHIGLSASLPALTVALNDAQAKLANLQANLTALATVSVPDPTQLALSLQAALSGVATLAAQLPTASISVNASLSADITAALAIIASIEGIVADIGFMLGGSGCVAYYYEGKARSFGHEVTGATSGGVAGGQPEDNVQALILATSDPDEWARLSAALRTS